MSATPQQREFEARIARIAAREGHTNHTLFMGLDESFKRAGPAAPELSPGFAQIMRNAVYPLSMVVSVLLGIVSHALGRWLDYQVSGMPDPLADPHMVMVTEAGIGFAIVMVLGCALRLRSSEHTTLKSLGVVMGMGVFHNVVPFWSETAASLFSPLWVSRMLTTSEAASLMWRGVILTF